MGSEMKMTNPEKRTSNAINDSTHLFTHPPSCEERLVVGVDLDLFQLIHCHLERVIINCYTVYHKLATCMHNNNSYVHP